jgi:hypothetical protein
LTSHTAPRVSEIINEVLSRVHMDSTAQTPPRDSDIINELVSRVTHGFDSPNNPLGLKYHQRSGVKGNARIRQPRQPLGTEKSSTNCCHGSRRDSTAHTAPRDSEITNELLSRVTHGFDSPNSPEGLRNNQRIAVMGDARIRQPKHPLGTQISSMKCCHG